MLNDKQKDIIDRYVDGSVDAIDTVMKLYKVYTPKLHNYLMKEEPFLAYMLTLYLSIK